MTTNITEITIRNSGEVVLVEETAVGNSLALSRRSIFPGDDYSAEVPRVQSICDVVHTEAYLGLPINPAALADWAGLRTDLLGSATVAAWFDTLPAINREDITAQIQAHDVLSLNDALSRVNYDSVKVELNQFLTNRNIGVELP